MSNETRLATNLARLTRAQLGNNNRHAMLRNWSFSLAGLRLIQKAGTSDNDAAITVQWRDITSSAVFCIAMLLLSSFCRVHCQNRVRYFPRIYEIIQAICWRHCYYRWSAVTLRKVTSNYVQDKHHQKLEGSMWLSFRPHEDFVEQTLYGFCSKKERRWV